MAPVNITSVQPRLRLRLRQASFSDDLGIFGTRVGPRVGPDKRSQTQREDWGLRRYLIALRNLAGAKFPIEITAYEPSERVRVPDYKLRFADGEMIGVEVTEATHPEFQRWLTQTNRSGEKVSPFPGDYGGDKPERIVVEDLSRALEKKIERYESKRYQAIPQCDLLIYESSEGSVMADPEVVLQRFVQAWQQRRLPFRQVHLLHGERVLLDVFGDRQTFSFEEDYDHDFVRWLERQARLARDGQAENLDLPNIAEELEALAKRDRRAVRSHIRNTLVHLIKWDYQPSRRSRSWLRSLLNARAELEELMADSPSLASEEFLVGTLREQYPKARKRALFEAKLSEDAVPLDCPFTDEQIFDEDYPPLEERDER